MNRKRDVLTSFEAISADIGASNAASTWSGTVSGEEQDMDALDGDAISFDHVIDNVIANELAHCDNLSDTIRPLPEHFTDGLGSGASSSHHGSLPARFFLPQTFSTIPPQQKPDALSGHDCRRSSGRNKCRLHSGDSKLADQDSVDEEEQNQVRHSAGVHDDFGVNAESLQTVHATLSEYAAAAHAIGSSSGLPVSSRKANVSGLRPHSFAFVLRSTPQGPQYRAIKPSPLASLSSSSSFCAMHWTDAEFPPSPPPPSVSVTAPARRWWSSPKATSPGWTAPQDGIGPEHVPKTGKLSVNQCGPKPPSRAAQVARSPHFNELYPDTGPPSARSACSAMQVKATCAATSLGDPSFAVASGTEMLQIEGDTVGEIQETTRHIREADVPLKSAVSAPPAQSIALLFSLANPLFMDDVGKPKPKPPPRTRTADCFLLQNCNGYQSRFFLTGVTKLQPRMADVVQKCTQLI